MYSLALFDGTEPAIQTVYATILIIFFVLVVLSWLVASRDWFKDEIAGADVYNEHRDQQNSKEA